MSLIPEEIITQVIDRNDIAEVIGSYIPIKKAGRNFKALCPFHNEKTPSFVVNPDKQIFHCFGCGVGGNVVRFVMLQEHAEFPEAVRVLADRVNVKIPERKSADQYQENIRQSIFKVNEIVAEHYHNILISDKSKAAQNARDYLKGRKISLDSVESFQLGFADDNWDSLLSAMRKKNISPVLLEKAGLVIQRENREGFYDRFRNRIIFPIIDTRGHYRAFGARAHIDGDSAKYINSPETAIYTKGHHLYGFYFAKEAISREDSVVVVEGYMDCITSHQAGVNKVVASLGTALTIEQIRLLRRYTKNVIMLFDMDQAGIMATIRSLDILVEEGMNVRIAQLEAGHDPDSFIRKFGKEDFIKRLGEAELLFDFKLDFLMGLYNIKDPEGKAKIAAEMLVSINQFNNAVVKAEYINRLSNKLNASEQALLTELRKLEKETPQDFREKRKEVVKLSSNGQPRAVEMDMLKLLLEEEELIPPAKGHVRPDDFEDERIRSIIKKMFELSGEGKKVELRNLLKDFSDQNTQNLISMLLADENKLIGDKEKLYKDYIARIKQDRLKLKRKALLLEIRDAETNNDSEKINTLKEEFNQIIKEI
ncbi:MAG: DNA primase [Candidatus Omnitrophica bacterium]|nr:DNA primase [Candidatus Omnitrophota bacterium]